MSADFFEHDLGHVHRGDMVVVHVANRQNVLLLDSTNLQRYRRGDSYNYFGGQAVRSPIRLAIPNDGHWYVIGDLGGASGRIRMSVEVLRAAA